MPGSGRIKALYSSSPAAVSGTLKRGEDCLEVNLNFGQENKGRRILVQAKSPKIAIFRLEESDEQAGREIELELKG